DLDSEPDLVIAMKLLRKSHGVMIAGKVIYGDLLTDYDKYREAVESTTLRRLGVKGLGKLKANTVLLGMKRSWKEASEESVSNIEYVDVIRMCLITRFGVGVVKNLTIDRRSVANEKVTIDVWWFVEDGGLTLLIAYLLSKHPSYRNRNATLRLFIVTTAETQDAEKVRMVTLLERFRIEATVHPVVVETVDPHPKTYAKFQKYSGLDEEGMQDKRTMYFMRLSDVMATQSSSASLVVASLPIPRVGIHIRKYLCQLECLIGQRPTILIRGNQETVLTYDL
ncbi:Slc12a3, partial [Symbiodinium microadriaticum]